MLQCKIFSGSDPGEVEREVNRFLTDHSKIMVHSVLQSSDQSKLHVSVFFYVRTRAVKMKEAATQEVAVNIKQGEFATN